MLHLDLFSGIGGFALAVEAVWPEAEHIFCEIDPYCRALLKKRFEGGVIYGDIRQFITDSAGKRFCRRSENITPKQTILHRQNIKLITDPRSQKSRGVSNREWEKISEIGEIHILTAGVPCQPASTAGKRRGKADDRWLWPETFEIIRMFRPRWAIIENVRGLLSLEGGVVFESLLTELESIGYEVQPFIIPACAVNAPHRRDRVWFVANRKSGGCLSGGDTSEGNQVSRKYNAEDRQQGKRQRIGIGEVSINTPDTDAEGLQGKPQRKFFGVSKKIRTFPRRKYGRAFATSEWGQNWLEVATRFCGMDDGLPAGVDGLKLSKSRHRVERLKALGNSIVPQVAVEIMRAIKDSNSTLTPTIGGAG